jgi:uncharacterized protein
VDPLIAISAATIPVEGVAIEAMVPSAWLDAVLADAKLAVGAGEWEARSDRKGGHLKARLSRSGHDVVVRGRVQAEIVLACARCLGPTRIAVDGELSLLLRPLPRAAHSPHGPHGHGGTGRASRPGASERGSAEDYEFSTEEAELDSFDGETVVLDGFVREAILLELPQFPLCSDGCVGIPAAPAGWPVVVAEPEPDIDPRLAPLGALRTKLTGEAPHHEHESAHGLAARIISPTKSPKKPMLRSSTRRGLGKGRKKVERKE